jgi:hypothetical protein
LIKKISYCRNSGRWIAFDEAGMPLGSFSSKQLAEKALEDYLRRIENDNSN